MGDELGTPNQTENLAASGQSEPAAPAAPRRVALPPRPVSVPPRPANSSLLPPRPLGSPPPLSQPLSQRSLSTPLPGLGRQPPPPPFRSSAGESAPPNAPALPTPVPSAPGQDAQRIQSLLAELASVRQALTETATALAKVTAERNAFRTQLTAAEAKILELSSAISAETQLRAEAAVRHAATSSALRAHIAELESALSESRKAAPEPAGLRRIRGIGPAYERALLGLGITTVAQIAQLSPEDIARIAPQIKAQAERITRDDWVGQARRLLAE